MADQSKMPSEQEFNGFVGRLREFRSTLPERDQVMLDAMVQSAFKTEEQGDVQGYWYAARGPYGGVVVGGPPPAFYYTPPPPVAVYASPWGITYASYW